MASEPAPPTADRDFRGQRDYIPWDAQVKLYGEERKRKRLQQNLE